MINEGDIIWLKVIDKNKPQLKKRHMYVCAKRKLGDKDFAVCTSNLLKLLGGNLISDISEDSISVPSNEYFTNPPFTKDTHILLTECFVIKNVKIDRSLLTDPPNLSEVYWNQFKQKFNPRRNINLDVRKTCDQNKGITSPYYE